MADKNIDLVMDIMVGLSVELGRAQMKVRDVMALSSGTVLQLDKKVDENVDLYVNGKLIGRGEVVVVDESLGIKITEVFKQAVGR
ncbi:MAG TPA: flagellar motor switch protein FliN [Candidatus Methylacidiphilales bacterium]